MVLQLLLGSSAQEMPPGLSALSRHAAFLTACIGHVFSAVTSKATPALSSAAGVEMYYCSGLQPGACLPWVTSGCINCCGLWVTPAHGS